MRMFIPRASHLGSEETGSSPVKRGLLSSPALKVIFFFSFSFILSADDALIVSSVYCGHASRLSLVVTDNRGASRGTSLQIIDCPLCFHCSLVCVCEFVASFHPSSCMGVCVLCFGCTETRECGCLYMCARRVVRAYVRTVSHLSSSPCACTHVHTLSLIALHGAWPLEEHPVPSASACSPSRHLIPRPSIKHCVLRGTLFSSVTMETRHVLILSQFALSWPRARSVRDIGCLRRGVHSSRQAG